MIPKSEIAVSILDNNVPQYYTYSCGKHEIILSSPAKYLNEIVAMICVECAKRMNHSPKEDNNGKNP